MPKRMAIIVGGGLFGDEGKGSTVDYLVRRYDAHTVFRYNGGSQAAHNVVTPEGLHHCFAQFGSGTLVPGIFTYLSQFMVIDPLRLVSEYETLSSKGIKDVIERLVISKKCPVITPFHKFAGQMRELARGANRFGSCGMGVGEAINDFTESPGDSLTIGDLARPNVLQRKLKKLQISKIVVGKKLLEPESNDKLQKCFDEIQSQNLLERCIESYSVFSSFPINFDDGTTLKRILNRPGTVVFEGAQGALLDKSRGFKPFITKSDCSFGNAERLLAGFEGKTIKLAVARAYATRHGRGPFVTEDPKLTKKLPDTHNVTNDWQGKFRVGWFDLIALNYGLEILGKPDGIVLTNIDRIANFDSIKICDGYRTKSGEIFPNYLYFKETDKLLKFLKEKLSLPILIISHGSTYKDKLET
ncbi:MAG: adenylosuccinate synthetase [Candidatus Yanofskybacteria bacterium]|nr:adenylosuccinate synthetase [Candidatus Yanofskybacteria bacterium]